MYSSLSIKGMMMKYSVLGVVAMMLLSGSVFAAETVSTDTSMLPEQKGLSKPGMLKKADLEKMITSWSDEKKKTSVSFSSSIGRRRMDPRKDKSKIAKYKKSGKVPFRLLATLSEYKELKGKKVGKRLSGSCKFYMLDSDGKLVLSKSSSLAKMCPS